MAKRINRGIYIPPTTVAQIKDCYNRAVRAIKAEQKIRARQRLFGYQDAETIQLYLLDNEQRQAFIQLCYLCGDFLKD